METLVYTPLDFAVSNNFNFYWILALYNLQCFGTSETRAKKSGKVKMEGGFHINKAIYAKRSLPMGTVNRNTIHEQGIYNCNTSLWTVG